MDILGGENSAYWTQVIYKSKHQFYNPIKQNDGHVRFLRHLLGCPVDIPFVPIVVFINSADLKIHVANHIVVNRCNLNRAFFRYNYQHDASPFLPRQYRLKHHGDDYQEHANPEREVQFLPLVEHDHCQHDAVDGFKVVAQVYGEGRYRA